jgi:2-polyprenyl-3-methyl-5-hydroxy-6-metoxy-1,4-benzoquinol methylase
VRERWNHNIHYHPLVLDAVPDGCERALDVGCGEGILARRLARRVPHVVAIDADARSIELAREQGGDVEYLLGDFMTEPLQPTSFDLVACIAALHHMDPRAALQRMGSLLRPGGRLVVVGLARSRHPADLPRDVAAVAATRARRLTHRHWESPAPTIWPPAHDYREIAAVARGALPGASFRRHLFFRYSIAWAKPVA